MKYKVLLYSSRLFEFVLEANSKEEAKLAATRRFYIAPTSPLSDQFAIDAFEIPNPVHVMVPTPSSIMDAVEAHEKKKMVKKKVTRRVGGHK